MLLTTQHLEEVDQLADDIVVIDHGRQIARGTADELKSAAGGERIEVCSAPTAALMTPAACWRGSRWAIHASTSGR